MSAKAGDDLLVAKQQPYQQDDRQHRTHQVQREMEERGRRRKRQEECEFRVRNPCNFTFSLPEFVSGILH